MRIYIAGLFLLGEMCLVFWGGIPAWGQEMPTLNLTGAAPAAVENASLDEILNATTRLSGEDQDFAKFYSIFTGDVFAHYGLTDQYPTELKKAIFRESKEFKDYKTELAGLRKDALGKLFSFGIYPTVPNYDLKRGGFDIDLGGSFGLTPLSKSKVLFMARPKASGPNPHMFLSASKPIGATIEDVIGQKNRLGIYFIFPVIKAEGGALIAPHVRVVLVDMQTNAIFIDSKFLEGGKKLSPASARAKALLMKAVAKSDPQSRSLTAESSRQPAGGAPASPPAVQDDVDSTQLFVSADGQHLDMGAIMRQLEQLDLPHQIALYHKALRVSPNDVAVSLWLAGALLRRGLPKDLEEAVSVLMNAINRERGVGAAAQLHGVLGLVFLEAQRIDSAKEEFQLALAGNPKQSDSLAGMGALALIQGDVEGATAKFKDSIRANPYGSNARAHYWFGVALKSKGDVKGAKKEFKKACKEDLPRGCAALEELNK